MNVLWLFLTVPWVGLQYVSVVFPDNTHLLVEQTWLETHTSIIGFLVPLKKIEKVYFTYIGVAAILTMWSRQF